MSKLAKFTRFCCDFLILSLLCFLDFIFHEWVKPFKRGFFCNDESLSYPFRESSITVLELCIIFAVPIAVIIFTELLKPLGGNGRKASESSSKLYKQSYKLGFRLLRIYKYVGSYLYGLALTLLASELSKKYVGRLRPHFFEVCNPKLLDGTTCSDSENQGRYIEDYVCLNQNDTRFSFQEAQQSFPSLHSSFTFYIMIYMVLYLQAVLKSRATKLLKHLLQFMAIMFAWYVAITRLADYWHHWSDVLAGITLGTFAAILCGHLIAEFFAHETPKDHLRIQTRKLPPLQVRPTSTTKSAAAAMAASAGVATATLPAYTFGSLQLHQAPQTIYESYANYGYIP